MSHYKNLMTHAQIKKVTSRKVDGRLSSKSVNSLAHEKAEVNVRSEQVMF